MTTWTGLSRDYRDAGALCDLVPWVGFVDDGVFFTKTGALGLVLELAGVDYECLDAEARSLVTARFEAALRLWDARAHLYQYVVKRPAPTPADDGHSHPAVDAVLRRRQLYRQAAGTAPFTVSSPMTSLARLA